MSYQSIFTATRIYILCCLLFVSFGAVAQENENVVTRQTLPILVSNKFSFTEGPAADKAGNVYFTDQPNNKIWKFDTKGKLTVFLDKAGRSNGMYFDKKGNLITCADAENELWSVNSKGVVTVLLKDFKGSHFNGPNDCWIDPMDGIYFTDPYFQRDYWKRKSPDAGIKGEFLYYLNRKTNKTVLVDSTLKKPNGIIGTPDGKALFVSDMGVRKIYKYTINPDGSLSDRTAFAEDLADGMTLDNQGNLYLAGNGIIVYNPQGKKIQELEVPSKWTANCCFGGSDKDILFITASESVYIMPMKVKGAE